MDDLLLAYHIHFAALIYLATSVNTLGKAISLAENVTWHDIGWFQAYNQLLVGWPVATLVILYPKITSFVSADSLVTSSLSTLLIISVYLSFVSLILGVVQCFGGYFARRGESL